MHFASISLGLFYDFKLNSQKKYFRRGDFFMLIMAMFVDKRHYLFLNFYIPKMKLCVKDNIFKTFYIYTYTYSCIWLMLFTQRSYISLIFIFYWVKKTAENKRAKSNTDLEDEGNRSTDTRALSELQLVLESLAQVLYYLIPFSLNNGNAAMRLSEFKKIWNVLIKQSLKICIW